MDEVHQAASYVHVELDGYLQGTHGHLTSMLTCLTAHSGSLPSKHDFLEILANPHVFPELPLDLDIKMSTTQILGKNATMGEDLEPDEQCLLNSIDQFIERKFGQEVTASIFFSFR